MKIPNDILKQATYVFGNEAKARLWFMTEINALNGNTPISRLNTNDGVEEIRAILLRIEYGEFT